MVIQVYCDACTINSRKVLAALEELKVDYTYHLIDFFASEQKSDKFKKISPFETVPAAKIDDLIITESNAILQYAADLSASDTMYPKDPKHRASVNCWLFWEQANWFSSCYVYLVENVVKPLMQAEPDQKALDAESERFHKCASLLDSQLSKTKWLTGPNVTIADFAIAAPMHLHRAQRLPLDKYPHLTRWMTDGMERLESWKKTQGPVNKALLPNGAPNGASHGTPDVRTTVNYTRAVDGLTELYFYESEAAKKIHEPGDEPVEIAVSDAWPHANEFGIDKQGFAVHSLKTKYNNWEEEQGVRAEFYPEVVTFLKETVGAQRVLVFDHTIRSEKNAKKALTDEKNTSQRSPVMLVHCDYTAESGPLRVRQLLPDEADHLLTRRFAFINVWKPINRIVYERPLAMCDATSCQDNDFFKLYLNYRDRIGENYVLTHSPSHKWWYFPRMTPEHVILLKTFDSSTDGRARFVGHSAFIDPTSPKDAPQRESVEIRTICFF